MVELNSAKAKNTPRIEFINLKANKAQDSPAKDIAYISVMCALLIGGQYAFSFVAGVEIVTLLLVCFSYVFGARRGALCALAFSFLRCIIFGFYPTAVILYLAYYPTVAVIFGIIGKTKRTKRAEKTEKSCDARTAARCIALNLMLAGMAAACVVLYFGDIVKISRLYKIALNVLLWVIFSLSVALAVVFDALSVAKRAFGKNTDKYAELVFVTSIAAVCTVCFTLLDDIITPLFFGYSHAVWIGYVYSSFTAMLPQTVCAVMSVATLFMPVTAAMKRAVKL